MTDDRSINTGTRIQFFDRKQEYAVLERNLPHWCQTGTVAFITWRTWDSLPHFVIQAWLAERDAWLMRHGLNAADPAWEQKLTCLTPSSRHEFHQFVSARWNDKLDESHGSCPLSRSDLAEIVADSRAHSDGSKYEPLDYVVMPNHVHLLSTFSSGDEMLSQCESWKHFTATKINRILGRKGRFWQQDGFDHLVRSESQFEQLRRYIADNPNRAGLAHAKFAHFSRSLGQTLSSSTSS